MPVDESPLEFLASRYGNVVKYDKDGNPSIFCKLPKMKSSDLDPSLPDHTHPAFIINGAEQDYILVGKYKGSFINEKDTGTIYSQPNMPPIISPPLRRMVAVSRSARTADQLLTQCRAFGGGASGMTVADRGFLLLLAQKNGWKPNGNQAFGQGQAIKTKYYRFGIQAKASEKYGWRGWQYECIQNHTTVAELAPDIAPQYWKKLRRIGGIEANPKDRDLAGRTKYTLNGSGPLDWYLDGTPSSINDIVGNGGEIDYGYRVVAGEIQILPNNNAADPASDLSMSSTEWRAILPNPVNDGYTLVAPGTPGTLHWSWSDNGKLMLDTKSSLSGWSSTPFNEITYNEDRLPFVPHIVKELGIFPTDTGKTILYTGVAEPIHQMEMAVQIRGGDYNENEATGRVAGMGSIRGQEAALPVNCNVRLRFMENT